MPVRWTIGEGKAERLRRTSREREAQPVGSLGRWLVASAPRGADLESPSRGTHRPTPFEDDAG